MKRATTLLKPSLTFLVLVAALLAIPPTCLAGSLEPPAAPAPTMRSLEELKPAWNRIIPTAQRFVDALDGNAVLDKETGLVWAKSPDATQRTWQAATEYCADLALGGRKGWRLPKREELASLIDPSVTEGTKLPAGHPFQGVATDAYWTATSNDSDAAFAWGVSMASGSVSSTAKTGALYVWPVRSSR